MPLRIDSPSIYLDGIGVIDDPVTDGVSQGLVVQLLVLLGNR